MIRPNSILQIYVAEKAPRNLVVAAHRHPRPPLQEITARQIGNDFFNSLLVGKAEQLVGFMMQDPVDRGLW